MKKSDFTIGQTVYIMNLFYNLDEMFSNITTAVVTKVGNKYVETDKTVSPFRIDNGEEFIKDYSPSKKLFLSLEEIVELKKCYDLSKRIRDKIQYGGRVILGLNSYQLTTILHILDGGIMDE